MSSVFKFLGFNGKKNIYNNLKSSKDLSIRFFIFKKLIDERATSVFLILFQLRLYSRFGFCGRIPSNQNIVVGDYLW